MKKVETGDVKFEELVKTIQTKDPKVGKGLENDKIWPSGLYETWAGCDSGRSW